RRSRVIPSERAPGPCTPCGVIFRAACSTKGCASAFTSIREPMRRSKIATAQTKATIIRTAARLFRERGFDAVSIADVMSAAGLTVGGFYRHFESKEALASAAIEAATAEKAAMRDEGPLAPGYLTALHCDNPGRGCPVAALVSEIARQTAPTRAAF